MAIRLAGLATWKNLDVNALCTPQLLFNLTCLERNGSTNVALCALGLNWMRALRGTPT